MTPRFSVTSASDECIFGSRNRTYDAYQLNSPYRDTFRRRSTPDFRLYSGPGGGGGSNYDMRAATGGHRYSLSLSNDDILSNDQLQQIRFDPRYRDCRSISNISLSSNSGGKSRNNSNNSLNSVHSGQMFGGSRSNVSTLPPKSWDTNPSIYIEEYVDEPVLVSSGGTSSARSSNEQIVQPLDELCMKSVSSAEDIPFIDGEGPSHGIMIDQRRRESNCRKTVSFDVLNNEGSNNNNNNNEGNGGKTDNCSCEGSSKVTLSNRCDIKGEDCVLTSRLIEERDKKILSDLTDEVTFKTKGAARFETTAELDQRRMIWKNQFTSINQLDPDMQLDQQRYEERRKKSRSSPDLRPCCDHCCICCECFPEPESDIICKAHDNLCCCCTEPSVVDGYKNCRNLQEIYNKLDQVKPLKSKSLINLYSNPIIHRDVVPLGNINELILKRFPDAYLFRKTKQCKPDCKKFNPAKVKMADEAYAIQRPSTSTQKQSEEKSNIPPAAPPPPQEEQSLELFPKMKKKRKSLSEKIAEVLRRGKKKAVKGAATSGGGSGGR